MAVNLSLSSMEKVIERERERNVREKKGEVHEPRPLCRKELRKLWDQMEHVVIQVQICREGGREKEKMQHQKRQENFTVALVNVERQTLVKVQPYFLFQFPPPKLAFA